MGNYPAIHVNDRLYNLFQQKWNRTLGRNPVSSLRLFWACALAAVRVFTCSSKQQHRRQRLDYYQNLFPTIDRSSVSYGDCSCGLLHGMRNACSTDVLVWNLTRLATAVCACAFPTLHCHGSRSWVYHFSAKRILSRLSLHRPLHDSNLAIRHTNHLHGSSSETRRRCDRNVRYSQICTHLLQSDDINRQQFQDSDSRPAYARRYAVCVRRHGARGTCCWLSNLQTIRGSFCRHSLRRTFIKRTTRRQEFASP